MMFIKPNIQAGPAEKKNSSFMLRLMASYSAVLLVILCMGIYLYSISVNNIQIGIREQNRTILLNSVEQLDKDFVSMTTLARQMANNSQLVRLANMENTDDNEFYLLASQSKQSLTALLPTHMLLPIDSYFIRLKNTDYLVAFNYFEDISHYYAKNRLLASDMFDTWKTMLEEPDNHYKLLPVAPYTGTWTINPNNYFYLMSLEDFSFKNIPADICFELSREQMNRIFSELNLYEDGFICAIDSEGQPVFTIGPDNQPVDSDRLAEQQCYFQNLTYDEEGFSSYRDEGRNMLVTTFTSSHNKWIYYLVQPSNSTFYSLGSYQALFMLCVVLALGFGFIMIFLLSRRNSRPLTDMDKQLTESRLKEQELLHLAKQQEPVLKISYLRQIMKGTISSQEEMNYVSDYLKLPDSESHKYMVLYCSIYLNKYEVSTGGSAVVGIAASDYDRIIHDALARFFGEPLYMYSPQDRSYAILIATDKDADRQTICDYTAGAFTELHNYLMEQHSIWIFGGLGNRNIPLTFTWKSFQQAREASRYTTNEHFFCLYESLNQDSNNYYYPAELGSQLSGFVEAGNRQQVEEIFKLIKKENLVKRSLSYHQMDWLLSDIRNSLVKIRFSIHEEEINREMLQTIDLRFEALPSLKLYEDLAMEICGITGCNTSENQLIGSIKTYIEGNYQDPALCLSKISDEFSISESYFSFLFKKTTGENFSAYLENIRMAQALHLIKNTNAKISDLYMDLGYNNPSSFRRAFKKIYGVSPASIRELPAERFPC